MNGHRMITQKSLLRKLFFLFLLTITVSNSTLAQDGKTLFMQNCASCHALDKNLTGPALLGVEARWGGNTKKLKSWILNSGKFLTTGDPYATKLYGDWGKVQMTSFEGVLDDKQIDAILNYINTWKPPVATPGAAGGTAKDSDNTLLYGILTIILAIVAFVLLQVNANLKKVADSRSGNPVPQPIPFWKNKMYIASFSIILFMIGGYMTTRGAIGLGRNKDYQPTQPIFYSHKVHAGVNQINCQYCHTGADEGRHANIPSVNVCMNCHKAINEYKGEKLFHEDGTEVNGTEEINKLYKYAGFNPAKPNDWDPKNAKPIAWTQVHSLPDFVYFNHSQHVDVGKLACQTCHGEVTKMDEIKQVSELSMSWCVNCHRETKVQFKENGYYSIYEKFHEDMKKGIIDSTKGITIGDLGGTECQKCHY